MTRYDIVPHRTQVFIDQGTSVHTVRGEAHRVTGWLDAELADGRLDATKPFGGHIIVEVSRFSSGNSVYDREMHRVIDSRRFPTIEGELESVTPTAEPDRFDLGGILTFHGQRRRVEGEVRVTEPSPGALLVEGQQTFDIRDWGVEPPRISFRIGELVAEPVVQVRVRIAAERKEASGS